VSLSQFKPDVSLIRFLPEHARRKRYDPKQIAAQAKNWEAEHRKKENDRRDLYSECHGLELDVKDAEAIKRFAVKLMLPDEPQEQYRERNKAWAR
jgi:hypothetical protein